LLLLAPLHHQKSTEIIPKYVVFVVSPSIGTVDSVAPILAQLKENYPDIIVIGYFPRPEVISQAQDNPTLLRKLESFVDLIGIESLLSKRLTLIPTVHLFSHAKSGKIFQGLPKTLGRLAGLNRLVISTIANIHMRQFSKRQYIEYGTVFSPSTTLVIGDFNEVSKPFMGCLRRHANHVLFCGVNHGVDIDRRTKWTVQPHFNLFTRRHCFLFSHEEKAYYRSRFGLDETEMSVVGVQKHDKFWMQQQDAVTNALPAKKALNNRQALLISRPASSSYLPTNRKRRALNDLRRVIIEELGFKLLVKLHPKETDRQELFDCLGHQGNGTKWAFVDESVEALGWQVAFSVCFYSGVCTDMIMIGTPTIEYLDLNGLNELEGLGAVTMSDGSPALSYRANGLVLGVSNQQELRAMVKKIIDDPEACLRVCRNNYDRLFTEPNGSTVKTVETVITLVGEHQHNKIVG
jgi:hypothetical protein